jgi:hypothetical protein
MHTDSHTSSAKTEIKLWKLKLKHTKADWQDMTGRRWCGKTSYYILKEQATRQARITVNRCWKQGISILERVRVAIFRCNIQVVWRKECENSRTVYRARRFNSQTTITQCGQKVICKLWLGQVSFTTVLELTVLNTILIASHNAHSSTKIDFRLAFVSLRLNTTYSFPLHVNVMYI